MIPSEKEIGHASERISYANEKKVQSITKIRGNQKENRLPPNPSTMRKMSLVSFLLFVLLVSLLISITSYGSVGLYRDNKNKIQYILHVNRPRPINRIFIRNMQRAGQSLIFVSGAANGGFWNTLKKATGTSLPNVQQRNMSAFSVYHQELPKKPMKEQTTAENATINEVLSQSNVKPPLKKPSVPPVKHPAIIVDDETLLDPAYIPNMRLTHTPPSEAIQKKYGFKVLICQPLGLDQKGKPQYLIGTDRPITLDQMKQPGKHDELTKFFFGVGLTLDRNAPEYIQWHENRNIAMNVQKTLIAEIKYQQYSILKEINQRQMALLEKTLDEAEQKQKKLTMSTTNVSQTQHSQTNDNTNLQKNTTNEDT